MASPVTGIGATGGNEWSWLAPFITGIGSLATSGQGMNDARRAAGMADPFSGERGRYQGNLRDYMTANPVDPTKVMAGSNNALAMLTNLMQNPNSLKNMPGYQFGLNQALEGVNRGAGASGMLGSGNRLAALQDRGEGYAQSWQNQIFNQLLGNVGANVNVANLGLNAQGQGENQLADLAGAHVGSPTAAAQALLGGRQQQTGSIGAGIGGIANALPGGIAALQRLLNGGGGGGFNVPANPNIMGTGGDYGGGGFVGPPDIVGTGGDYGGFDWIDTLGIG